jgi:cytochrome P450
VAILCPNDPDYRSRIVRTDPREPNFRSTSNVSIPENAAVTSFETQETLSLVSFQTVGLTRNLFSGIDAMSGLVGTQSLISTRGKEWQQQRGWFAPAFSMAHLLTLLPGMIEDALICRKRLADVAEKEAKVKLADEFGRFTIDVIGRSVGDIRVGSLTGESPIRHYFLKAIGSTSTQGDAPWRRISQTIKHKWYVVLSLCFEF